MTLVWRVAIAVVCQLEVLAIIGAGLGVPFLRRIPTVSSVAGRFFVFGVIVLVSLAWHWWGNRA